LLLVVCLVAANASLLSAENRSARIYVYARRDTAARRWLAISCGNAVVAEIKQGTFFAVDLEPGQYVLSLERGVPIVIDAHSSEASFVRLDWHYGMERAPIPVLSKAPEKQARKEMKFLIYISPRQVHSSLVPRSDPDPPVEPRLHTRDEE
jgi:hypothetical protein